MTAVQTQEVMREQVLGEVLNTLSSSLSQRVSSVRTWLTENAEDWNFTSNLKENIGSGRWFRGVGTLLGLSVAAISLWPNMSPVSASAMIPEDAAVRDEYRSNMIMPLAYGSDSGRRMGPSAAVVPLSRVPERPMIRMRSTLHQPSELGTMLRRAGLGALDSDRAASLIAAEVPLRNLEAGTQFDITLGRRDAAGGKRPLERMAFRARFDLELTLVRRDGVLQLERQPIAVDSTPLRIRGTVGSGLYRSARGAGVPAKVLQQYLQALSAHVDLESDIHHADRFDIILQHKRSARGEVQAGDLIFAGVERDNKPRVQLMRWGQSGQLVDAAAINKPRAQVGSPVVGARMSSQFGMRRHPVLGYARLHAGLDYAAPTGTPIYAVSDAVVQYAGRRGGHGNYVRLEHGGGLGSGYSHMSKIAVSSGTRVRAGQVIGYVGSTGLSTGPHLHWEVYRNGRAVNPLSVQFSTATHMGGKEIADFQREMAQLKSLKAGLKGDKIAP